MMYDELVKRLRTECTLPYQTLQLMREAADAIEELSRENESLAKSVNEASEILRKRWIPVTERLPELNKEVLVYAVCKIDGFIGSSVFALSERFLFKFFPSSKGTEEWRSPWQYFMTDYEITHWMPLSEPQEEES